MGLYFFSYFLISFYCRILLPKSLTGSTPLEIMIMHKYFYFVSHNVTKVSLTETYTRGSNGVRSLKGVSKP